MQVRSLGWEDPLEEGMANHSDILAWEIPWTEEPGGLQSRVSQRVKHNWAGTHVHKNWTSKEQKQRVREREKLNWESGTGRRIRGESALFSGGVCTVTSWMTSRAPWSWGVYLLIWVLVPPYSLKCLDNHPHHLRLAKTDPGNRKKPKFFRTKAVQGRQWGSVVGWVDPGNSSPGDDVQPELWGN